MSVIIGDLLKFFMTISNQIFVLDNKCMEFGKDYTLHNLKGLQKSNNLQFVF